MPGVGPHTIRVGNTDAYSGPASAYGSIARGDAAYFRMINDGGGINGRKIDFTSVDDGYDPERTVEATKRLVETEQVAFLFNAIGTPTNLAVQPYLNDRGIPQLFIASGADRWADPKGHPWTMGWQPSYRIEAQIYAKYILKERPDAKIAILYQNDDFGRDYLAGVKDVLGGNYDSRVVAASVQGDGPDHRAAGGEAAGLGRDGADHGRDAQIRDADDPPRPRHGLASATLFDERLDLGGRGDRPRRTGGGQRHHHRRFHERSERSGLEPRPGHDRL